MNLTFRICLCAATCLASNGKISFSPLLAQGQQPNVDNAAPTVSGRETPLPPYDDDAVWTLLFQDPEAARSLAFRYDEQRDKLTSYERGRVLNAIAISYAMQGQLRDALSYFEQAYRNAETRDDRNQMAAMLVNMGNTHRMLGELETAIARFSEGVKLAEGANAYSHWSAALLNLADMMSMYQAHQLALPIYREAEKIVPLIDDRLAQQQYALRVSTARSLYGVGDYAASSDMLARAEAIHEDGDLPVLFLGDLLELKALNALAKRDLDAARRNVDSCLEAMASNDMKLDMQRCHVADARVALQTGDLPRAESALANLKQGLDDPPAGGAAYPEVFERDYFTLMSVLSEKQGEPEVALEALREATRLRDDIEANRQTVQLALMSAGFLDTGRELRLELLDTRARANELEIGRQRIFLIGGSIVTALLTLALFLAMRLFYQAREQRRIVADALDERDTLMRELRHRVGNNFQTIISLVNQQSRGMDQRDSDESRAFRDLKGRLNAFSALQRQLQETQDALVVPMPQFVSEIITGLVAVFGGNIETEIAIDERSFPARVAAPLGLIINELVSNTLEHAFVGARRSPKIAVSITRDTEIHTLTIADNGRGFDPQTRPDGTSSLGLSIVSDLIEQLNGSSTITSSPSGTMWTIRFACPPG